MEKELFKILILIARPAAGKSEIIHYLKGIPTPERISRFHIGSMEEIDDFPMLWAWFEEDALLERMEHPRLHTNSDGYFRWNYLWDVLIERMNLEYQKKVRDLGSSVSETTFLVEFSRGAEHGGYRSAFNHLSPEILEKSAIMYVDVSWEESLRKNRLRFNPEKPDSILQHSLPDEKLERLYRESDWEEFRRADPGYLLVQEKSIPYTIFDNSDDLTTKGGELLGRQLERLMNSLWINYCCKKE